MKVCLVTGSARGLGRVFSERLSKAGYRVFATMRDPMGKNVSAAAELGAFARVLNLDVGDGRSVVTACEQVLAEAGRVDDLINNAGYGYWGAVEETSEESVEKIFDINVFGPLRLIRAIAPIMRSQGSGVIVQISSMGGRIVSPMIGVYQASKHALEAVSEALAYELAPFGVRVAIIEPGNVDSAPRIEICGRLVDKSSAYQGLHQMFVERKKSRPQAKATPDSVADAVLAAIEEPMCPLRMLVGEDAVAADGVRRSRNDAGYAQWLWDYLQFRW